MKKQIINFSSSLRYAILIKMNHGKRQGNNGQNNTCYGG